jgi:hypothetical protein
MKHPDNVDETEEEKGIEGLRNRLMVIDEKIAELTAEAIALEEEDGVVEQ